MKHKGTVMKSTGSWYQVRAGDTTYRCQIKGKLRMKQSDTTNPVAVGDHVHFQIESVPDQTGVITSVEPRTNYIIRKSTNLSRQAHILATNLDQAILVITIKQPKTLLTFVDRFLVAAEAYKIPAILIINKTDIYDEKDLEEACYWQALYSDIGYPTYLVSAKTGDNLQQVGARLQDKVSLVAGNSGVGKSTLINQIDPALNLKTAAISEYHDRGKHTTTFYEMFPLSRGGFIIDSPGIKGFGIIDIAEQEICHHFPEMFERLTDCKYHNCTHTHEPGCAVKSAVENGEIAWSRFNSYLNILEGDQDKYRAPE